MVVGYGENSLSLNSFSNVSWEHAVSKLHVAVHTLMQFLRLFLAVFIPNLAYQSTLLWFGVIMKPCHLTCLKPQGTSPQ